MRRFSSVKLLCLSVKNDLYSEFFSLVTGTYKNQNSSFIWIPLQYLFHHQKTFQIFETVFHNTGFPVVSD